MGTKLANGDSGLSVLTELNTLIPETSSAFDPADITLTDKETYFSSYAQSGALTVTDPVNSYGLGVAFTVKIVADGSAIYLPATWKEISNDYATDSDDYQLTVAYYGTDWVYSLLKLS